jgi:hypothetical protein
LKVSIQSEINGRQPPIAAPSAMADKDIITKPGAFVDSLICWCIFRIIF